MAPAVAALRDAAASVTVTDPAMTLLSDSDGAAVTTGKEWLERIVAQVAAPVRWDLCMQTMADLGVTALIELPPAGTLTGLARRALPGVAQLAIKTPDQLDAARDLIEEHLADSDRHSHGHLPEWRLIVAPTSGTFRSPPGTAARQPDRGHGRPHRRTSARSSRAAASARSRRRGPRRSSNGWWKTGIRSARASHLSVSSPGSGDGSPRTEGRRMTSPQPVRSFTPFAPAPGARILSLGGYQPGNVVTNDDLAAQVDTSDEWIRSRVGIVSRRFAGPEESVTDMAVVAGGKALAGSGLSPGDIDLVIVATCSTEAPIPNVSALVAYRLGIVAPGAYDLNAACAGFCYALANASDAIRAGTARHVLVIGSEKMTAWIDPTDRSTCIIFADGAGAAVVGPVADGEPPGIGPVAWGSAGDLADRIIIADRNSFLHQEGQAVFRWATTAMHPIAVQACERAGVRGERPVRVRSPPGEPADHRGHRAPARRAARAPGGRHRALGQHVLGLDPAGAVADGRARGRQAGVVGPAARIRRGVVLRGAGDHGTLAAPGPGRPGRAGTDPTPRPPGTGRRPVRTLQIRSNGHERAGDSRRAW